MEPIGMPHRMITGPPGIGKTTVIREVAHRLRAFHPAGFYTEEIRDKGMRRGFRLLTMDGRQHILAHVDHPGPHRVSRYGVDVAGFEQLLGSLDLLRSPARVIIIDEIGKMECLSATFVDTVMALLSSRKLVLATVAVKGEGLIRQVKERSDCRLIKVTLANRQGLADTLASEVIEDLGTIENRTGHIGTGRNGIG